MLFCAKITILTQSPKNAERNGDNACMQYNGVLLRATLCCFYHASNVYTCRLQVPRSINQSHRNPSNIYLLATLKYNAVSYSIIMILETRLYGGVCEYMSRYIEKEAFSLSKCSPAIQICQTVIILPFAFYLNNLLVRIIIAYSGVLSIFASH